MANARALDKRRKSVRNIRKITRTMELIATARFKKAMDRATAATAYTRRITKLVADLASSGLEVRHPLMEPRDATNTALLLVLTGNRGLCGGYNGNVIRQTLPRLSELKDSIATVQLEVSGKRGISALHFRGIEPNETFLSFDDQPKFAEVELIANRYLEEYVAGRLDRLDVTYTRFISIGKQEAVVETLLPLGSIEGAEKVDASESSGRGESMYEFLPSAESILEEVVPTSFKVKLFKCFLDAAVSEQIARMVAMKAATENAGEMIKQLSMTYNRARQSQITGEIMEIIGGVEALKN
ncbi:MAG: ATP synthase F1 subunit gamma [Planctomycetaceae bacterium]|nr:ATP synthase F1 subunit gamma [Planctomycetales bacterium]MCB9927220.1 ATP synthase F1 subunit gamma [Planctomycetaceae bacterium]